MIRLVTVLAFPDLYSVGKEVEVVDAGKLVVTANHFGVVDTAMIIATICPSADTCRNNAPCLR